MAIYQGDLFGSFKGKLGKVYGRIVHGVNLGAKNPGTKSKSWKPTSSQADNMERFKTLAQLASAFRRSSNIGLKAYARQLGPLVSPFDAFIVYNQGAVSVMGGEAEVDHGSVKLSKENGLPAVGFGNANFTSAGVVKATWTPNADVEPADGQDKVALVVYQPDSNQCVLSTEALRTDAAAEVPVPSTWTGMTVHVYGFCIGNGRNTQGMLSESYYLGTGSIS